MFLSTFVQSQTPLYCNDEVQVGANLTGNYLPLLKDKTVGVVANQTSMVKVQTFYKKGAVEVLTHTDEHLVDFLVSQNIKIKSVFSPEHGFRGKADAGEKVSSGKDVQTGLPIISLYGNHKKPTASDLKGIDILIFDIQDVGARFYTYISTLHYVMEACAENNVALMVLDRPNPNGYYVDGPVLQPKFKSFVGMHPVPVVHGLTVGEYAQMINGEGWLKDSLNCKLTVIPCEGWDHTKFYKLPVKPSPNLPNMTAVYLYPGLCFFEGTVVSVGRGTDKPFQVIGHPNFDDKTFAFIPKPTQGAKKPKLKGEKCYGIDFTQLGVDSIRAQKQINLHWLILFYKKLNLGSAFFLKNNFFDLLAGTDTLRHQIIEGRSEKDIRLSWQNNLKTYLKIRQKYLLYKDFK